MADEREDLTQLSDPLRSGDPLRRGLRPAASEHLVNLRTLDIAVVAAGAMGCVLFAGLLNVMSMDAAVLLAAAIAALAAGWLKFAPRASKTVRRAELPMARPVATRSEFPLTPETGVAIIERLPDPIILLDRSGRIILHNRAAMNIVGQGAARRHISTVMRVPEVLEAVAHVVEGEAAQVVEYAQPVPIERHYHAFIAPVIAAAADNAKERQRNVLILLHDLTTLKRAEQMRADFVANASHELRTPLASMSGFVETLQGPARDDPDARDKFLGIMQEQAERMGRLINDLLSLSRIELNEHVRPSDRVDLASIIRDTADMLSPLAEKEGVTISIDIEEDLPQPLGDRDELVQVCQNLLANAFKYGGSGGRVEVSLRRDLPQGGDNTSSADPLPGSIVMTVRDFGHGIEREHIPRLTERFYRVNVEQSRRRGGTGLGLAIVKHIVNRHMGSLSIDSELGVGSTFKVFLPVDQKSILASVVARSPANVTGDVT
ncbi:MAG: ATP-binding protein [Pseudomonadota bacterium]